MTPDDFIIGIRQSVIQSNIEAYQTMFSNTTIEQAKDPYGKRAISLFQGLDVAQRAIFFEILRQVSVDATSTLLGILDGTTFIEASPQDFTLRYADGTLLNGDLQGILLADEERS
jgi:hypothetical protein